VTRTRDEVVQGPVLTLNEDAEEAQSEEEEAQREHQGAHDATPRVEARAIRLDHAKAKYGHADGPAARRPRVTEIEELPGGENDGDDDI